MNPAIAIRPETDADVEAIRDVTVSAFKTLAISGHTEQFIVAALRTARALTVSLVAEADQTNVVSNRLESQKLRKKSFFWHLTSGASQSP